MYIPDISHGKKHNHVSRPLLQFTVIILQIYHTGAFRIKVHIDKTVFVGNAYSKHIQLV